MPHKNKDKHLIQGERYHAYNRGRNKQIVFHDEQDYAMFLYLLKKYLDPSFLEEKLDPKTKIITLVPTKYPLYQEVELHAYCLMPNHFHLLLKLKTKYGMSKLLSVVCSCFTAYYNEKYEAEGSVWQGTYRAVRVFDPRQYLHLSRYIHINPYPTVSLSGLMDCPSSYSAYVGRQHIPWLITEEILGYFAGYQKSTSKVYKSFVEEYLGLQGDDREEEEMFLDGLKLE
ncbi:hypothetical protein GW793_03325 [bacterium]|uniref:Transposase IS200-like domain-containing protein n=2 Tax=Katanobacteria TaxID=422282 RepID=A0A2M7X5C6_UNCKA|nr:hypothetical protein [bacterium]PIP56431.1 MAG: hypothetical protein COX05_03070 [candidate division WWE3 bacterium CG22_combo_CG10-13_8_21_14_all_39_12]PJA41375.1 MAG: hypothetical protein CO179_00105 [candidate division WWE3 bacterium CG_4_9_14_3_um_filter_39_7]